MSALEEELASQPDVWLPWWAAPRGSSPSSTVRWGVAVRPRRRGGPRVVGQRGSPREVRSWWLTPVSTVVTGQVLALRLAVARGRDLDQPPGLAKITRTH